MVSAEWHEGGVLGEQRSAVRRDLHCQIKSTAACRGGGGATELQGGPSCDLYP